MERNETCEACKYLTSRFFGDGTTLYFCGRKPGVCIGASGALEGQWFARACKDFEAANVKFLRFFELP